MLASGGHLGFLLVAFAVFWGQKKTLPGIATAPFVVPILIQALLFVTDLCQRTCWRRAASAFEHLLFPIDQRIDVVSCQLKSVSMRDRIGGAGFHAIATENAPGIIDVIHLRVALTSRNAGCFGVLRCLNVNAIRRACRSTQEAPDALLQATLVAVQDMNPSVARLEIHRLGGQELPRLRGHLPLRCSCHHRQTLRQHRSVQ